MTLDLRHLAVILDAGRKAADDLQDAGLSAALSHMAETAAGLALAEVGESAIWDVEADFEQLAQRYR